MPPIAAGIKCRPIKDDDIPALSVLLHAGFPERDPAYWIRAFEILATREAPSAYPRFGFLLEVDRVVVGCIILIFSEVETLRCHLSSWYVEPAYRSYASFLIAAATKDKTVTYMNISPAPHTLGVIEFQGFKRYSSGQFFTFPLLSAPRKSVRARRYVKGIVEHRLTPIDLALIDDHASRGCIAYLADTRDHTLPFIFLRRCVLKGMLPSLQLVYCRDIEDFETCASALGRAMFRDGNFIIQLDAHRPVKGTIGAFIANHSPKYFKGAHAPRRGDLAFCEAVLFGI